MMMCAMILSFALTPKLSAGIADSVVFQNDSVFTIEGVKEELKTDGEWIKVTKGEIDPNAVADKSGGFDEEINTDYVWRPTNVEAGWSPYTNGYWTYTNCSWMWVSYYHWGWRTHHYGRWWYSDRWGWVWSPGFVWAPAWVVWMYNDGYCGWYPISPWVRYHYEYGYRCNIIRYRVTCWTFVETRYFADPIPPRVPIVDPRGHNTSIIKSSVFDGNPNITNTGVNNNGPKVKTIEEVTGKRMAVNDVGMYNNTGKYPETSINVKKIDERTDTWKNNNEIKNNDPNRNKDGGTNNSGDKEVWYKHNNDGDNGTKTKDPNKNNEGNKNNEVNKNKDPNKNNDGNNNNDGNKQYTPPPTPPKQDPPKNETKKESPPPVKKDEGNKDSKK